MSEISTDDLLAMLPELIDAGVRAALGRQATISQGLALHIGTVISSEGTSAQVQLDADPPNTPVAVQLATPADISDRVLVFTTNGGGVYAVGNGAAQAISPQALGIAISALPAASALTGAEEVPIDQFGVTARTTTQDIANLGGINANVADALYSGTTTIPPLTALTPIAVTTLLDGPPVLDLTTPATPTVTASGLHIFSVTLHQTAALTTPFDFECVVRPGLGFTLRIAETHGSAPFNFCSVSLAAHMLAGDEVIFALANHDAAVSAVCALTVGAVRVT